MESSIWLCGDLDLLVDEELVKKAKDHGLNISRFFENQLHGYFIFIDKKQNIYTPYNSDQLTEIKDDKHYNQNDKSNNLNSYSYNQLRVCGVAGYHRGLRSF